MKKLGTIVMLLAAVLVAFFAIKFFEQGYRFSHMDGDNIIFSRVLAAGLDSDGPVVAFSSLNVTGTGVVILTVCLIYFVVVRVAGNRG